MQGRRGEAPEAALHAAARTTANDCRERSRFDASKGPKDDPLS